MTALACFFHLAQCHPSGVESGSMPNGLGTTAGQAVLGNPIEVCGFLQGFSGDIRPALVKGGEFFRGTYEDMVGVGASSSTLEQISVSTV